ncbi:MAG TPA: pyridoxal phosphate-dependent aminotransferase [Candidatus Cloacimonadota bacterium]|nr:pyridoxal phosphate-dependent aminotransferase [Candidatus Cloacimonadota bacterium]HPT71766.1 pyridoxal phosphate-dependent aminotransferase [Candidatus Cloacimonadota bacterium]
MLSQVSSRILDIEKSLIRQIYDSAPSDAINLGLGEIQFPMTDFLKEKAAELIHSTAFYYTPNAGLSELRESVAHYYNDDLNANGVCIMNGAEEALYATLTTFIDTGDKVVIVEPYYPAYNSIVRMLGGIPISLPLDSDNQFSLNLALLQETLKQKPKCMIFSHPSNPLGTVFTREEMQAIVAACRQNDVILIVDEVYRELSLDTPIPSFYGSYEKLLVISGVSKSHCMTGWRIGWVIGKPEHIQPIIITHQYISTCAGNLGQRLATQALSEQGMRSISRLNDSLRTNYFVCMETLCHLNQIEIVKPTAAFYLFLKLGCDDLEFSRSLAERGLITAPGRAFGKLGTGWLRISYGLGMAKLEKGLEILVNAYHICH